MFVLCLLNCLHTSLEFTQARFMVFVSFKLAICSLNLMKQRFILMNVYRHVTLNVDTIVIVSMNYIIII